VRFRHAICNEVFEKWNFRESCRFVKQCGYEGLEIAHFTLAADPGSITAGQRREYRDILAGEGLAFVGLHWVMVAPPGLHVTTPDQGLRSRSWDHIRRLVDLCADLGPNGVIVFGSPKQRSTVDGATREEATRNFVEGLRSVAPLAEARGVTVLVEALPSNQTDVILSLDEAAAIVRGIGSPAIQTMFDTHNAVEETEPHSVLVERHFDLIRHVHVNENDGGHCGTGDYDFLTLLETLARLDYRGWVSLEAFDFRPGPERIAQESITCLEGLAEKVVWPKR
jgi:sugar phosphate isomerase/epimerase